MRKFIPIIENKAPGEPSVFLPENLLREARRQKDIPEGNVPEVCVLDPDGDLADYLIEKGYARINRFWACFHLKKIYSHPSFFKVGFFHHEQQGFPIEI